MPYKISFAIIRHCYVDDEIVRLLHVVFTRKLFSYGMPGVAKAGVIGDHAITVDEFKTIYAIYKKYEGKDLFVFHSERFDYDA